MDNSKFSELINCEIISIFYYPLFSKSSKINIVLDRCDLTFDLVGEGGCFDLGRNKQLCFVERQDSYEIVSPIYQRHQGYTNRVMSISFDEKPFQLNIRTTLFGMISFKYVSEKDFNVNVTMRGIPQVKSQIYQKIEVMSDALKEYYPNIKNIVEQLDEIVGEESNIFYKAQILDLNSFDYSNIKDIFSHLKVLNRSLKSLSEGK